MIETLDISNGNGDSALREVIVAVVVEVQVSTEVEGAEAGTGINP